MSLPQALLVLADGTWFVGRSFGADASNVGEVVFNTSMSGYQEILTDPSYRGQIVTMTSPHIGNYGVNALDAESDGVQVAGLVVREVSRVASNQRATGTLPEYLQQAGVPAITGVDTRALTRKIRDAGAIMGAIVPGATAADVPAIVERIVTSPAYDELDYVAACSVPSPRWVHVLPTNDRYAPHRIELREDRPAGNAPVVVVVDFGVKFSILRLLAETGVHVRLVPHDTPAAAVLDGAPAGVLLSNGPGDPGRMDEAVARIQAMLGKLPIFGICLGHQLLSRAVGGSTFKLKFGHRGPNQPVKDVATGRVEITSQNHGYAVRFDDAPASITVSHLNLNDGTVEGIALPSLRAFSVQHHPEAGPGPHDAAVMFERFRASLATVTT